MKNIILAFCLLFFCNILAQDANTLMGIPRVPNIASITNATIANRGNIVYNEDDDQIYRYDGTTWIAIDGTDNQNASEVPLATNVNVNGTEATDLETNVEEVIQAIAPITSKAGRVFYPPSIEIDVTTLTQPGAPDETVDLYQQYVNQYDLSVNSTTINGNVINYQTARSTSAPANIPLYAANELFYYVTFADESVFNITGLSDTGILSYRIVGQPTDFNTLINVVFVVK